MSPRLPDNTNRLLCQAFSSFKVWTLYPLTLDISGQKIESSQKHMQIALKLLVIFWSRANLIYRIYSIKRRPRINAASSCGVYSNNRLKKHMVIIASIAVGDFE